MDLDECALSEDDPCENGECSNTIGSFECLCQDGFQGALCEEDIDECSICDDVTDAVECNGLCFNSAECSNTVGSFSCSCTLFWQGDLCNSGTFCSSSPCGAQTRRCSNLPSPTSTGVHFTGYIVAHRGVGNLSLYSH